MMKKILISAPLLVLALLNAAKAQLNVGALAAPDASAALQVTSTNGGFRPPQVSLTSTSSFGLTAWTVASAANGMIVYNSNASITGSVTYPAYGAGLYQWDGTGWVAPSRTPIVLCSGNGTVSATTTNNTPTAQLDLGTEYIQTADVTISGNNKITFNTPGTYKIDAAVICNFTSNNTSSTGLIFFALPKNSAPGQYFYYAAGPVQAGSNSTLNVNYLMQGSYIVSMALNDYIYIKGDTYAIGSYNAQILSLQITRIK